MAKLDKYIKKELGKGISKARIKSALIQAGYKKEDINHSFQRFFPKKPMPPAIKYIVIALVIVGVGYVAFSLISDYLDYLEQRPVPVIIHTAIVLPEFQGKIRCQAILEEDVNYFTSRVNLREEYSLIPDFYVFLSLYKQDPSVLEDPYLKEILKKVAAEDKEYAEAVERNKPVLKSIINKEITSFEQCADELCEALFMFNKAIVEANLDHCNTLIYPINKICQALATKNRDICDEIKPEKNRNI